MMLNIKILLSIMISIATTAVYGQSRLSLDSILTRIDKENQNLRAYSNRATSLNEKAEGATAWMAPMLGAGTFMTPYPGKSVMDDRDKGAYMFSVEQDIPNFGKLNKQKEYQKSLSAVELEARNVTFNNMRGQARKLYYEWLVIEKKLTLARENEQILSTLRKLAQIRYPYNKSSLSSIYAGEGKIAEAQNMQVMLQADIRKKMYSLNTLMNRQPSFQFSIDTSYKIQFTPPPASDTSYFHHGHSLIRQMDRNIDAMNLNIKAMKAEAKPDFRIRFDHMANRASMMPAQFTAMVMMSIPIAPWSSKMYKSEVKSMEFGISAMKNERDAMLTEMKNMVESILADIRSMRVRLENYEQRIIPALKKSFEANQIAYEENRLDLPQVLQSFETLNMTRINYLDDLQSYYLMIAEYEREIEK